MYFCSLKPSSLEGNCTDGTHGQNMIYYQNSHKSVKLLKPTNPSALSIKAIIHGVKFSDQVFFTFSKLTCMAALLSKDQMKFSKLNSDFSNLIFASCHKLSKTYSPSVLFKDGLKLYVLKA